ncbi:MAG: GyrI-like domain-containing protein [Acidimicrobiia bacterium]|nr:GyrI-like domain-containing protein [Acidimicrobiia bacterium]
MSDESPAAEHSRPIYIERVNAAIDYIERHLSDELSLDEVAAVAHFSPYHFHRIFGLMVGETLNRFVNRLRLERAATWLIQQPDRPVTDIASASGLGTPSSFARSFRDMFGMTASEWRNGGFQRWEQAPVRELLDNIGEVREGYGITRTSLSSDGNRLVWEIACGDLAPTVVDVINVPDLEVAYVRHTGAYQGAVDVFADIFARLMSWAGPRQLINEESWVLAIYHDNPSITEDDKLRVSACIDVPPGTEATGDVGSMSLDGGLCAVARFELGPQDYGKAWFALAGGWLPDSGYEPADRLPFERYPVGATTTSVLAEVVDIYLPVRPLRRY